MKIKSGKLKKSASNLAKEALFGSYRGAMQVGDLLYESHCVFV